MGSWKLQCGHDPKAVENTSMPSYPDSTCRGFNAATTRRPWRTTTIRYSCQGQCRASMRPRPEGRGEPGMPSAEFDIFNVLQCGHDPKAVENGRILRPATPSGTASMRPRPEGRGERRAGAANGRDPYAASMRPRPEGRGEPMPNRRHVRRIPRELQCGHDPKAVENRIAGGGGNAAD